MFKPFSIIFFVVVMVWVGSILVTTEPVERIDRVCVPIDYVGKTTTSAMLMAGEEYGLETDRLFKKAEYGCKYIVWRTFYEDDWLKSSQSHDTKKEHRITTTKEEKEDKKEETDDTKK